MCDVNDSVIDIDDYGEFPDRFYTDSYTHWMAIPELPKE